jgi:flagellar hook protein FlgE
MFDALKASSALPLFYRPAISINGEELVDGGVADPIPVEEAYRLGARRIMVLRSRPANVVKTDVSVRDSLGQSHTISISFTHTGDNAWTWTATNPATTPATSLGTGALTFDANGQLETPITGAMPTVTLPGANGSDPTDLTLDLSGLTQLDGASDLQATADGAAAGYLTTFAVDKTGVITGVYSNGVREELGQIAVATFANPGGLSKTGGNLWDVSANSGQPQVGAAGVSGRGNISPGTLEMSNVDLAQQFTNMIQAERGFQANSRVITASDQILQDLVNLIR